MPNDNPRNAAIAALEPRDRLFYLIGLVAQADVWLETSLRHLWRKLTGPSVAAFVVPMQFDPLVEQCKVMVKEAETAEPIRAAGAGALQSAKAAHLERNRVVHDMWLPDIVDGEIREPESFMRQQNLKYEISGKTVAKTLTDVAAVRVSLQRSNMRVISLSLLVPWSGRRLGGPGLVSEDPMTLRIVEDRFDLLPDGGVRPHPD